MGIRVERVTTLAGCEMCRTIAGQVWGGDAACSTAQMIVHSTYGGVTLLAFVDDVPVGFLFSFPAIYRGQVSLWSHETGVLDPYLHQGVGFRLKSEQRSIARELGYRTIAWTFDPLVARNAYFNLHKLGATITEYKENVYGADDSDLVNQGLETDRFVAVWDTSTGAQSNDMRRKEGDAEHRTEHPLLICDGLFPVIHTYPSDERLVWTEVPMSFGELIQQDRKAASAWRSAFRETALRLFQEGFRPVQLRREGDTAGYVWSQEERQ